MRVLAEKLVLKFASNFFLRTDCGIYAEYIFSKLTFLAVYPCKLF